MSLRDHLHTVRALVRRGRNEIIRVPGAAIPGVLAPTIFFLGLNGVFGKLIELRGFEADSYLSFLLPISLLQGAGFTGAATGVNLARDIEQGWFDRLLASPAPRWVLLAGTVLSAGVRCLIPAAVVLTVAFLLGAHFPGALGLVIAVALTMATATVAAFYGTMLALKFRTQAAAPLMQAGTLLFILTTTAYAPLDLLTGWLQEVARFNPVTQIVEAVRQGFVGQVTWHDTWPGIAAVLGLGIVLAALALRQMRRMAA